MKYKLCDFRKTEKLEQREIAEKLDISLSFYSKIELGTRNPSYNFIKKFKEIFPDADIAKIFFET